MKHGKKYNEAAKKVDRAQLYDVADALALVKRMQPQSLMRQWKFISEQAATDVMRISRSVEQSYCPTEQARA